MKYHEICDCCGHKITAYTLPLNDEMAKAFIIFAEAYIEGDEKPLKKGEIGLNNTQYSNFQNLRHFGIITQSERGQAWYLTDQGKKFYYGKAFILTPAAHMNSMTLPSGHEAWKTHKGTRRSAKITDYFQPKYKQREEYQEEKSQQSSLF